MIKINEVMTVGLLEKFLENYFDDIKVGVRVPGGEVYYITGATMKSVGADTPLVFELLTEKSLETTKIAPMKVGDNQERDFYQP